MCLGIPAQVRELVDDRQLARVDVGGVGRVVSMALLADEHIAPDDWVLVHVGFAMAKIDEADALRTVDLLERMTEAYEDEIAATERSQLDVAEGNP